MPSLESFAQVFELVKENTKQGLSEIAYGLWIKDIQAVKFEDSTAFLEVSSDFKKGVLEEKYIPLLSKSFEEVMGFETQISISSADKKPPAPPPEPEEVSPMRRQGMLPNGEYEYTFENFIVGSSNRFAHAAALAVAENPANTYNPLFIYGASGLGKTHLLFAICDQVRQSRPNMNILFVKGEEFTNELIDAIYRETTRNFHDKYRLADILLVDDIQFIGGKESTQEEFFHTFNALYQDGKQIILTSDRPPKEIKTLEDRLRTRFEWGLLADIQPPDFETRTAIIRRKAELLDFSIPSDVTEYMANQLTTNIRQLEGAVKKLKAYEMLEGQPPTLIGAQNAIQDILNDSQPVPVTIDRIISEVSRTYNVSSEDMHSRKRAAPISNARQIAMYIIREITQISTTAIGDKFGGRDHSTVVYATQQVESKMEKDLQYKETVEDIIRNIRSS